MITFFYEPSTRTRASFEIAMHYLGGQIVFSTENAKEFSSVTKGETLQDTIQVLSNYQPDVFVIRYHQTGGLQALRSHTIPIINAGDGAGEHPSQALLDTYTIYQHTQTLDNLHIAFVGDIKNGRTVSSLSKLLAQYKNTTLYFVAPTHLQTSQDLQKYCHKHKVSYKLLHTIDDLPHDIHAIYMTRTQKERGSHIDDLSLYTLTPQRMQYFSKDTIVLHPLPRNGELPTSIDTDPRAKYLTDQVHNGLLIRMALLYKLLYK